ncbi:MAG: sulfite exporter TauE/SafE family protein [Polyangiaceae bacterium]|nr:sulfite exporter TauE/SafE family protein [Polyangiaceae bacterium]
MSALELGGALLMGLMGGLHCAAMCGPVAAVLCSGPAHESNAARAVRGLAPQAGRLGTYAALGALLGAVGGAVRGVLPLEVVQLGARVVTALLLLGVGLYAAGFGRAQVARLEGLAAPLFRRVARGWPRGGGERSPAAGLMHGAIWGLVPCGLVYGALGLAAVSGSPASGALVMVAFGVGTLPSMVLIGLFADGFRRFVRDGRIRRGAGLLLATAGTVHLALAVQWARIVFVPSEAAAAPAAIEDAPATEPTAPPPPPAAPPACH